MSIPVKSAGTGNIYLGDKIVAKSGCEGGTEFKILSPEDGIDLFNQLTSIGYNNDSSNGQKRAIGTNRTDQPGLRYMILDKKIIGFDITMHANGTGSYPRVRFSFGNKDGTYYYNGNYHRFRPMLALETSGRDYNSSSSGHMSVWTQDENGNDRGYLTINKSQPYDLVNYIGNLVNGQWNITAKAQSGGEELSRTRDDKFDLYSIGVEGHIRGSGTFGRIDKAIVYLSDS